MHILHDIQPFRSLHLIKVLYSRNHSHTPPAMYLPDELIALICYCSVQQSLCSLSTLLTLAAVSSQFRDVILCSPFTSPFFSSITRNDYYPIHSSVSLFVKNISSFTYPKVNISITKIDFIFVPQVNASLVASLYFP